MKQLIVKPIKYNLTWKYDQVSISDIRKDLDAIEALGATHIDFDVDMSYGDPTLEIKAIQKVVETDEEYQVRMDAVKKLGQRRIDAELAEYKRLKPKYEGQ